MRKMVYAALCAVLGIVLLGAKVNAQNINVVINGQPVSFVGTPPQEINGSVLVPLRGVFEQLGANVQYNPTSHTIFAVKGQTTVSLSLGSDTAYVDNQEQTLAQPPTVLVGTTLVPLRFVAEAFGAYVEWEAQTSTVEISTSNSAAYPSGPPVGQPPLGGGGNPAISRISGRIISVDDGYGGPPTTITVDTSTGPVQVNLTSHTTIFQRQSGSQPLPASPTELLQGDTVTASIWPNGNARAIDITSTPPQLSTLKGHIISIDNLGNPSQISIGSPSGPVQVSVDGHTEVTKWVGSDQPVTVTIGDLRLGDDVTAELWPNGSAKAIHIHLNERRGRVLTVQNLPNGNYAVVLDNGQIVQVDHHAHFLHNQHESERPIQPGDQVSIRQRPGSQTGYTVDLTF